MRENLALYLHSFSPAQCSLNERLFNQAHQAPPPKQSFYWMVKPVPPASSAVTPRQRARRHLWLPESGLGTQ